MWKLVVAAIAESHEQSVGLRTPSTVYVGSRQSPLLAWEYARNSKISRRHVSNSGIATARSFIFIHRRKDEDFKKGSVVCVFSCWCF